MESLIPEKESPKNWWDGKWERKFLGKIKDFESKKEEIHEKKHLKAYLKGHDQFQNGFKDGIDIYTRYPKRVPNYFQVKQELIKIK